MAIDQHFIRGMQAAIDQLWLERDTYQPFTASWRALDNAAKRLCRKRDRFDGKPVLAPDTRIDLVDCSETE